MSLMNLLPMERLGAHERAPGQMAFGVLLPWVSAADGNRVAVKIIHERDQFLRTGGSREFPLTHATDPTYGDFWSTEVEIRASPQTAGTSWGQPGRYVYRYVVSNPNVGVLDWVADPFAREFGVGKLSAFTLGYTPYVWSAGETGWKTPRLSDLVIYELMLAEFAPDLDAAIERLPYLADLGVNCLEVMPVSNVALTVDWGFLPIGYFGVDERFGKRSDFQRFVDAAHQCGLAVLLDAVYGHTSTQFPYSDLYRRLQYRENPFLGAFAKDYFGESTDFNRPFTADFFHTVNQHWLEVYHVDGFRYDCVPNYWDGPMGAGYANLVYTTYQTAKRRVADGGAWTRFDAGPGEPLRLIQCAEQLEDPEGVLAQTYTNCTWQNRTLDAAARVAAAPHRHLTDLGFAFGLAGFPASAVHDGERMPKLGLQYIETHDHSRFVCRFGTLASDNDLLREGDRAQWYKVQPFVIGTLLAPGIPLLWQGQELAENYYVPDSGMGRVMLLRPVRWDYFYDAIGRDMLSLVRRCLDLRRSAAEFRTGSHYFYNEDARYQSRGLLLFSRAEAGRFSLVALNFSDVEQTVPFWFPEAGDYVEQLHGHPWDTRAEVAALSEQWLTIPPHYGRVWRKA